MTFSVLALLALRSAVIAIIWSIVSSSTIPMPFLWSQTRVEQREYPGSEWVQMYYYAVSHCDCPQTPSGFPNDISFS